MADENTHVFERDTVRPEDEKHKFQTQFGVRELTDSEASDLQSQGLIVNRVPDDADAVDGREEALATAQAIIDAPRTEGTPAHPEEVLAQRVVDEHNGDPTAQPVGAVPADQGTPEEDVDQGNAPEAAGTEPVAKSRKR